MLGLATRRIRQPKAAFKLHGKAVAILDKLQTAIAEEARGVDKKEDRGDRRAGGA